MPFFSLVYLSRSAASSIESFNELEVPPNCLLFFRVWRCLVGIANVNTEADKRKNINLTLYPERKFLNMMKGSTSTIVLVNEVTNFFFFSMRGGNKAVAIE